MRSLKQKWEKKTLAIYVNRIYTEKRSGAKWGKIPDLKG
jgi:hypothetical protein